MPTGFFRAVGLNGRLIVISGFASWRPIAIPTTTRSRAFDGTKSFLQVLLLAKELKLLKLGVVSVDGSKFDADASKHRSVTYQRAGELVEQLRLEIADLMARAEVADAGGDADPQALPKELARCQALRDQLDAARRRLETAAKARALADAVAYEAKVAARNKRKGSAKGKHPKAPDDTPRPDEQSNLSDPDSRLMRKSKSHEYRQAYNAQAVVDAGGSQLILGTRISPPDRSGRQRSQRVGGVHRNVPCRSGLPKTALADSGCAHGKEVDRLTRRGIEVLVATGATGHRRAHDFRPSKAKTPPKEPKAEWRKVMAARLSSEEGRALYKLRQQTVEPVFGIIKVNRTVCGCPLRCKQFFGG